MTFSLGLVHDLLSLSLSLSLSFLSLCIHDTHPKRNLEADGRKYVQYHYLLHVIREKQASTSIARWPLCTEMSQRQVELMLSMKMLS